MSDTPPLATASSHLLGPAEQEELLKRGLVRVSIAAEGIDPLLDRRLQQLRGALRADAPPRLLGELLPDLEHAVLTADNVRQERARQIADTLQTLIHQLLARDMPSATAKALRQLEKQFDDLSELHAALPLHLKELSQLQANVLDTDEASHPGGLWSRLFGKHASVIDQPASVPTEQQIEPTSAPLPDDAPSNITEPEQSFSLIATHVESTLLRLLGELQVLDTQQSVCNQLYEQINKGLNWYKLAAVLDNLATLVLDAQQTRRTEFEGYLLQLNQRLGQFQCNLEEAHSSYTGSLQQEQELAGNIRGQVETLHEEVRDANDLLELKTNVETKLDYLLENVDKARQLQEQRDNEVSTRLKSMVQRIQTMEAEAQTFRHHLEQQRQQAMIDDLTGLANRAGLQQRMEEEFERLQRYGGQLLLAVLDVDHFKSINDRFGHLAGDKVLRLIAMQLLRRLRKTDFVGRFGGEEFVILMPGTTLEQGIIALEELRSGIENSPFHFKNDPVPVTISIGVTDVHDDDSLDSLFERADQAMYQAKDQGRNRVVRADLAC